MPTKGVNDRIKLIFSRLYLGEIDSETATRQLSRLPGSFLADALVDGFNRGETRALDCNEDGEPHLMAPRYGQS
jgi:hypothetical protein